MSEGSRRAIEEAARRLNYTPNLLGRSLKSRQCTDIGVIVPNISNAYYSALIQGIYDGANRSGYHTILCSSYRDPVTEGENVRVLMEKQVCGIIVSSISRDPSPLQSALEYGCRVVAVEQDVPLSCTKVGFHYRKGGTLAARHLLDRGHRRLGFIGAPLDRSSRIETLKGFREALEERGLPIREEWIRLAQAEQDGGGHVYEFQNGRSAADWFAELADRPTGYVCVNDMTALGAVSQFVKRGLRVPEDLSVVGFDNIPYAEIATPPLTTVDQCTYEMGKLAAKLLIEGVESPDLPDSSVLLEPTLVERESVRRKS